MNKQFSKLENAVLQWFKDHYTSENLDAQIEAASIVEREFTGQAICVELKVPSSLAELSKYQFSKNPIDGPEIKGPGIDGHGTAKLFVNEGHISLLEIYANGDSIPENPEEFVLSAFFD